MPVDHGTDDEIMKREDESQIGGLVRRPTVESVYVDWASLPDPASEAAFRSIAENFPPVPPTVDDVVDAFIRLGSADQAIVIDVVTAHHRLTVSREDAKRREDVRRLLQRATDAVAEPVPVGPPFGDGGESRDCGEFVTPADVRILERVNEVNLANQRRARAHGWPE